MHGALGWTTPQDGDIVIVHSPMSPIEWMIRQVPDAARFGSSSRDRALHLARGYARAHDLDLWCHDDGDVRLLETHRPAPAVRPRLQGRCVGA